MKTKELIEEAEKRMYRILKAREEEMFEELKVARQCLHFKNCYCDNQDCKNKYCPLNKEFEQEELELCKSCNCMTKTKQGTNICGKCGKDKGGE